MDVDLDRERISLGIKQTTEDPWMKQASEFPIDRIVDAEVTRIVPFGAFVRLNDQVEGLIHVSEMATKHIDSPAQVVHVGDVVQAKVTEINESKHRISLSMREAAEELGIEIEVEEILPRDVKSRGRSEKVEAAPKKENAPKDEAKEAKAEEPAKETKAEEPAKEAAPAEKADKATEADKKTEKADAPAEKPAENKEDAKDEKPAEKAEDPKEEKADDKADEKPAEEKKEEK